MEAGLEAVLGRLARVDRAAVSRYVYEVAERLDERAAAFRASLWESPEPEDRDRLRGFADDLEADILARGLFPCEAWVATFELLSAAARLSEPEVAARIIRFAGPPEWTILNSTRAPCRRRALAGDADALGFLAQIAPAFSSAGLGPTSIDPPPAPFWVSFPAALRADYWHLRALPIEEMPWWCAWDGGLP